MNTKEEKERLKLIHQTIVQIEEKSNYRYVEIISQGEFRDVVTCTQQGKLKAGKIAAVDRVKNPQFDSWPSLDQRNIVKLEETLFMPHVPSLCFIMDRHFTDLHEMVSKSLFINDQNNADDLKRWLLHVLTGLDHLHKNKLCHLNLKASNVLITYNSVARIGGFSRLSSSTKPVTE